MFQPSDRTENTQVKINVLVANAFSWSRLVFRFLSTFNPEADLESHYMKAQHGKGPMDGVGGTIKNQV